MYSLGTGLQAGDLGFQAGPGEASRMCKQLAINPPKMVAHV